LQDFHVVVDPVQLVFVLQQTRLQLAQNFVRLFEVLEHLHELLVVRRQIRDYLRLQLAQIVVDFLAVLLEVHVRVLLAAQLVEQYELLVL
jgi:hypothetical protein